MTNVVRTGLVALLFTAATFEIATAHTAYDGWWSLTFVTRRGGCDPSYNFTVQINNGIVTHPNLVRFRGRVSRNGSVRASVTAGDKHATGSGRLNRTAGRGSWSGYSGNARCSGVWSAQRS
jgi:hypothetical protein